MSCLDATLIQLPLSSHEPALLTHEAAMLRRLRSDVLGLICLFEASRTPDDWATWWAAWARHRQAWRFTRQSARIRLLQLQAFDLTDPDTTTDGTVSILQAAKDPHSALLWAGMWNAACQAVQWSQVLRLDASDDVAHSLENYLSWTLDRETDLHLRLSAHARQAVLESTGDTEAARQASFESADWGGLREGGPAFFLIVRICRPPRSPSAARTTSQAFAVEARPNNA